MVALKVRKVGNSLGVTLPREATSALHVEDGDTLFLTEAPGGYRVTPYDPQFEAQMKIAGEIMNEDRDLLRALAK